VWKSIGRLFFLLLIAALGAGAGLLIIPELLKTKTYRVTGTVTHGGEKPRWSTDDHLITVLFIPVDRDKDTNVYSARTVDSDAGTYAVEGVPPGEYMVSVLVLDPLPGKDLLNLAYDPKNTPLRRTVAGNDTIDIDIPRDPPRRGGGRGRNGGQAERPAADPVPAKAEEPGAEK
jgi:hypothetical protein